MCLACERNQLASLGSAKALNLIIFNEKPPVSPFSESHCPRHIINLKNKQFGQTANVGKGKNKFKSELEYVQNLSSQSKSLGLFFELAKAYEKFLNTVNPQ